MNFFRWISLTLSRLMSYLVRVCSLFPTTFYKDLFSLSRKELSFLCDESEISKFELYCSFLSRLSVQSPLRRYLFLVLYGDKMTRDHYLAVARILKLDFLVPCKLSRHEVFSVLKQMDLNFESYEVS